MIDQVFFEYLQATATLEGTLKYATGEGLTPPYYIMYKIVDMERPETMCDFQGECGRALFQFSAYLGGSQGDASNAAATILFLERLKVQVARIKGRIDNGVQAYRIWQNITSGVRVLEGQTLETWGAMFEVDLWWEEEELAT